MRCPPASSAWPWRRAKRTRDCCRLPTSFGWRTRSFRGSSNRVLRREALHGASIALTNESSTSVRQLRLLLEVRHGVKPAAYERQSLRGMHEHFDAALVIGDEALRWRVRPPEGFVQAMDLASEWTEWTGLPFVFACWALRKDLDPARAQWLGQFLLTSLDEAEQDLPRLATGLPTELGATPVLTDYLRNFIYRLGAEEVESMVRFRDLLQANDIACTAQ